MKDCRIRNHIENMMTYRGVYFKDKLRRWIWGLHDSVNQRRGLAPEQCLPYESLSNTYHTTSLQSLSQLVNSLTEKLDRAVIYRQIEAPILRDWKRALEYVRRFMS